MLPKKRTNGIALLNERIRELEAQVTEKVSLAKRRTNEEREEMKGIARVIQNSAAEAIAHIPLHLMVENLNQTFKRINEIANEKKLSRELKESLNQVAQELKMNVGEMQLSMHNAVNALNQEIHKADLLEAVYLDADRFFNENEPNDSKPELQIEQKATDTYS